MNNKYNKLLQLSQNKVNIIVINSNNYNKDYITLKILPYYQLMIIKLINFINKKIILSNFIILMQYSIMGILLQKTELKVEKDFLKNGKEALEKYKKLVSEEKSTYHLALIDINMPEMDGPTLVKEIRAFERQNKF